MLRKKTGGRKLGTPNKTTSETRAILTRALSSELENLPELLESLDSKERLDIVCRLMPFVMPRYESIFDAPGVNNTEPEFVAPKIINIVAMEDSKLEQSG